MYLITPTLLNSFHYWFNYQAEDSEDESGNIITSSQKEIKAREEYLSMLRREEIEKSSAMQAGIDFENKIFDYCCNSAPGESSIICEIGDMVAGGYWQQRVSKQLDGFLLYGRADVIKHDTIYDIKRSKSYEVGKYYLSAQHRIYLYCTGIPKFSYIISDERSWWREDYFNHPAIEDEIRAMLAVFTSHIEKVDAEAKELYYRHWKAN